MIDYVDMYFALVKSGKISIDKVPVKYRENVAAKLNKK